MNQKGVHKLDRDIMAQNDPVGLAQGIVLLVLILNEDHSNFGKISFYRTFQMKNNLHIS